DKKLVKYILNERLYFHHYNFVGIFVKKPTNMKKLVLPFLILAAGILTAQETDSIPKNEQINEYNKWSIEFSGGVHKPSRPFAEGYYTTTPSFGQGQLGVRYMFNEKFGLRLGLGYNHIEGDDESL